MGRHREILWSWVDFAGNQTAEKINKTNHFGDLEKMKKSNTAKSETKISKRGGVRTGAGRKPGTRNKPTSNHLYQPCCDALAKAMDGANESNFIAAMMALGGDPDVTREALGLSRAQFLQKWGEFIAAVSDRHSRA